MASKVSICNQALSRLGADSITSLTDNTIEAKACNLIYDDIADEVILEGDWTAAIQRASLAKTANTPTFGYTNEFQLPVSPFCLKVLNVDEIPVGYNAYKIEGDKLLTDMSTVKIRYLGRITDTEKYGTLLQRVIIARLALELGYRLTADKALLDRLEQQYDRVLSQALANDGQQGSKDEISTPDLTDVRDV